MTDFNPWAFVLIAVLDVFGLWAAVIFVRYVHEIGRLGCIGIGIVTVMVVCAPLVGVLVVWWILTGAISELIERRRRGPRNE